MSKAHKKRSALYLKQFNDSLFTSQCLWVLFLFLIIEKGFFFLEIYFKTEKLLK